MVPVAAIARLPSWWHLNWLRASDGVVGGAPVTTRRPRGTSDGQVAQPSLRVLRIARPVENFSELSFFVPSCLFSRLERGVQLRGVNARRFTTDFVAPRSSAGKLTDADQARSAAGVRGAHRTGSQKGA